MRPVLELDQVRVERDGTPILNGISWRVAPGENWVLFGPNGAGKTTLLSVLTGYLWPTDGAVHVLGRKLGETDVFALRRHIALVSDSLRQMMNGALTGLEVLVTGPRAHLNVFAPPTRREAAMAREVAEITDTTALLDRPFAVMSTGEKQRILIARALTLSPQMLILDEPCAGLDIAAREFVLRTVGLAAKRGRAPAILLTTHHVEEITPDFTHCLMIRSGRVFAAGAVDRVLNSPRVSELFGVGVNVSHHGGRWAARVDG